MKKIAWLAVLIFIDQISKYWVVKNLEIPRKITDFFSLTFVENSGIAFSIPVPRMALLVAVSVIVICMGHHLWKTKSSKLEEFSLVLIISGAIGNLIDRFINGAVIDFLSFWSFPIFNLADVFITCGVMIYLFMEIFSVSKTD